MFIFLVLGMDVGGYEETNYGPGGHMGPVDLFNWTLVAGQSSNSGFKQDAVQSTQCSVWMVPVFRCWDGEPGHGATVEPLSHHQSGSGVGATEVDQVSGSTQRRRLVEEKRAVSLDVPTLQLMRPLALQLELKLA